MNYSYIIILAAVFLACCSNKKAEQQKSATNAFYETAIRYRATGQTDSTFVYFNKAKEVFIRQNDRPKIGICLANMAAISIAVGDNFGGQELAFQALPFLDERDTSLTRYIAITFNELGIASYNLKDYRRAISFYEKSLRYTHNTATALILKDNIANCYRDMRAYDRSLAIYTSLLKQPLDTTEYARVLTNYATTRWLKDPGYPAAAPLRKAMRIREQQNDYEALNSSFGHLSDYYAASRRDSALYFATKMYTAANQNQNPDNRLEALQKLVGLAPPAGAQRYFSVYQALNDSLQTARNAAKNQFAVIRYETEKEKANNLELQKENLKKKYQILLQWGLLGAALLLLAGILFWFKKRRERMELEKVNAVQEIALKNAKKVHDVLANGIYRTMSEVQYRNDLGKDELLDQLDYLYHRSRDISREDDSRAKSDFHNRLTDLFRSFESEQTHVVTEGLNETLWNDVPAKTLAEIECVLLELMVNMRKHSAATEVSTRFNRASGIIYIHYRDNGIGLPETIANKSGLANTETRIKAIYGDIIFGSAGNEGTDIRITFPVA